MRLLRLLASLLGAWLFRLGRRLLFWARGAGEPGFEPAEWREPAADGPPEHWLRHIQERSSWIPRGRRPGGRASTAVRRPAIASPVAAPPPGYRPTLAAVVAPGPSILRNDPVRKPGAARFRMTAFLRPNPHQEAGSAGARNGGAPAPEADAEPAAREPGRAKPAGAAAKATPRSAPRRQRRAPAILPAIAPVEGDAEAPTAREVVAPAAAPAPAPAETVPVMAFPELPVQPGAGMAVGMPQEARMPRDVHEAEDADSPHWPGDGTRDADHRWPELPEAHTERWDPQSSRSSMREQLHLVRLAAEQAGRGSSWSGPPS